MACSLGPLSWSILLVCSLDPLWLVTACVSEFLCGCGGIGGFGGEVGLVACRVQSMGWSLGASFLQEACLLTG